MKFLSTLLIAAVATIPTLARTVTPSSTMTSKTVSVGSFNEIDVSRVKLIVFIGTCNGTVKVNAPDNLINELKIKNSGGELKINFPDNFNIKGNPRTTVEVTVGTLKEIDAALSANVEVRGNLSTNGNLDLSASTSARILIGKANAASCDIEGSTSGVISIQELKTSGKTDIENSTSSSTKIAYLQCKNLDAEVHTSGSIVIKAGKAQFAEFEASTSGSIKAADMSVDSGIAEAGTSGSIKCNIANATRISTSTGGNVTNNSSRVSGNGNVVVVGR